MGGRTGSRMATLKLSQSRAVLSAKRLGSPAGAPMRSVRRARPQRPRRMMIGPCELARVSCATGSPPRTAISLR